MFNFFRMKRELPLERTETLRGLDKIRMDFTEMLEAGRFAFMTATNAYLGGTSPDIVREDLLRTDKQINRAERTIRKELIIHTAVRGMKDFPECLVMMSIVKDAERLGDYAKNIFDLSILSPVEPEGNDRERMVVLKNLIGQIFISAKRIFETHDEECARDMIRESTWIAKQCDANTVRILQSEAPTKYDASYVLIYRYMKRIVAHLKNITSSVVQPVHKLDFTSKLTADLDQSGDLLDRRTELDSLLGEDE